MQQNAKDELEDLDIDLENDTFDKVKTLQTVQNEHSPHVHADSSQGNLSAKQPYQSITLKS